jgi:hypothetical protein
MTENETTGTAIEQIAPGALALAQSGGPLSIADLADRLLRPPPLAPLDSPFPQPPAAKSVTDKLRASLRSVAAAFGGVQPTERRKLEAAEVKSLTDESSIITAITKPLGARLKDIQEIIRMHGDFIAEEQGMANERISGGVGEGHWLAATPGSPFEIPVDGYEDAWQQRYVKGGVDTSIRALEALEEAGDITRKEYLAMTAEVRVLDETKMASFIHKNPERGLEILRKISTKGAPSASLYAPKK